MEKAIWKYELGVEDTQFIKMPKGAQVLTVQVQHLKPCIWALVDPTQKDTEDKTFHLYGTGHTIKDVDHKRYIGSFQISGGQLVFHLFEDRL